MNSLTQVDTGAHRITRIAPLGKPFIDSLRDRPLEEQVETLYDATADLRIPGFLLGTSLRHLVVKSTRNNAGARWISFVEVVPHDDPRVLQFPESQSRKSSRDAMILQLYDYIILHPNATTAALHDTASL